MTGARIFVATLFLLLAASFVASTGLLIHEFQGIGWESMALAHSHLFVFYPLFGLLALAAYYLPAVVLVDLYWRHLSYGRLRFIVGTVVVVGAAVFVAQRLDGDPRSYYEVAPGALAADRGEPGGCNPADGQCRRAPLMSALEQLRERGRLGVAKFGRSCAVDHMLEEPDEMAKQRYCFAAGRMLNGRECCSAQHRLREEVGRLRIEQPSLSGLYDRQLFLPLKVFFVIVVVVIAGLLAIWRSRLDEHYADKVPAIERGVLIGAFAMLFWPIMDYGYQQTANVLFGRLEAGVQLRYSLVIVPWAVCLLFFFLRRLTKQSEMIGQMAGVVTAAVAVLRYEDLNDWAVRLLGIGADRWIVAVLVVLTAIGFIMLGKRGGGRPVPPGPVSA